MTYRVVLFDLDETLWECLQTIKQAAEKTTARYPHLTNFETGIKPLVAEFPDKAFDYTFLLMPLVIRLL
ncbi:unnamed protein product [Amoebophrya sp. A25]|nr:unnamed protein product [Amoebophrya sp. A25]|eukprot:GSA25T00027779001.1